MVEETLKDGSVAGLDLPTQVLAVVLTSVVEGAVHVVVVGLQFVHSQHLLLTLVRQLLRVLGQAGHRATLGVRGLQHTVD